MKISILLLLFVFIAESYGQNISSYKQELIKDSLKQDFKLLWKTLNETHPALYKFDPDKELLNLFEAKNCSINADMTQFDFYLLTKSLVNAIRCCHTDVLVPDGYSDNYLLKVCRMLPFDLMIKNKHAFVTQNFSRDSTIIPGTEILSVNGTSIGTIIDSIYQYVRGDGHIITWKEWWESGPQFKYDYSMFFKYSGMYKIEIQRPTNKAKETKEIEGITHLENEVIRESEKSKKGLPVEKPLELIIEKNNDIAILTIRTFLTPKIISAGQDYKKFLRSAFKTIKESNVKSLIIDLRNNNGGYTGHALQLYSYLTDTPFDVIEYAEVKGKNPFPGNIFFTPTFPDATNSRFIHSLPSGIQVTEFPAGKKLTVEQKPAGKNRFTGTLAVLINGGTASASSYFTYAVKMNKRGIFIGEEVGANVNGCPGWDEITLKLPYSGVKVVIPLVSVKFVKVPGLGQGRGLMPDYNVPLSIENYVNEKDPQMDLAKTLMHSQK